MDAPAASASLRKTPLNQTHRDAGARMVDFGGWDMPVEYSGIISEHMAVRERVGLFDVSHMGEIEIRGDSALALVQHVSCNDAAKLSDGQAQYSGLLTPQGTFVDDILVHRIAPDHYFLCVNASNQDADFAWITEHNTFGAAVENAGSRYIQLAIQGPRALETLAKLTTTQLADIGYYWFTHGQVRGVDALIARTGYTGEDGFEIYFAPAHAEEIWRAILAAGAEFDILPCGLGARNTLRLESAMSLYGHEIDGTTTPYEAGLGWIVKLKKGDFLGRDTLAAQKAAGVTRKIFGLEITGRGIARDGYRVLRDGQDIGWVTSGSMAPALDKNIALAMLPADASADDKLEVAIRQRSVEAKLTSLPFYSRKK